MPSAGQLSSQSIEPLIPEPAKPVQPHVNLAQRRWGDGVVPSSTVCPHQRETVLTQNAQMLGDSRLGKRELGSDHVRDCARTLLSVDKQLNNPPAHRVTEDGERVHVADRTSRDLYKS